MEKLEQAGIGLSCPLRYQIRTQNSLYLACSGNQPHDKKRLADTYTFCVPTMLRQKKKYPYPGSSRLLVREKSDTIIAVGNSVWRHPLISIISSLGSDSLDNWNSSQVNLQPLFGVPILSDPASSGLASILCLKSGTPGTVVVVVHWGGGEHRTSDAAILDSEWDVTSICAKHEMAWWWGG